jgi:hypothetical protein
MQVEKATAHIHPIFMSVTINVLKLYRMEECISPIKDVAAKIRDVEILAKLTSVNTPQIKKLRMLYGDAEIPDQDLLINQYIFICFINFKRKFHRNSYYFYSLFYSLLTLT